MKSEKLIGFIATACLALEAWTLTAVVDLKVQVAQLSARVNSIPQTQTKTTIAKE